MESKKKEMVVAQLNMDVMAEILSRLRVKDVIRFKSVCKSWLQLISSKEFIKLHLMNSSFKVPHSQSTYYIGPPPLFTLFPHTNFFYKQARLQCQDIVLFVGNSSDGLKCLFNYKFGIIHIWNPSIRQSACFPIKKKIPNKVACFWFGIHDDDYKLVLGIRPEKRTYDDDDDDGEEYQMHLISPYVGSHSYTSATLELRKEESRRFYREQGILFSGNVHWAVCKTRYLRREERRNSEYRTILCYNLGDGTMGRIGVPKSEANHVESIELGEIDGCFSALFDVESRGYEVWVMKEYGVEKSWTNVMFIERPLGKSLKSVSPFLSKQGCVESLVSPYQGEL